MPKNEGILQLLDEAKLRAKKEVEDALQLIESAKEKLLQEKQEEVNGIISRQADLEMNHAQAETKLNERDNDLAEIGNALSDWKKAIEVRASQIGTMAIDQKLIEECLELEKRYSELEKVYNAKWNRG